MRHNSCDRPPAACRDGSSFNTQGTWGHPRDPHTCLAAFRTQLWVTAKSIKQILFMQEYCHANTVQNERCPPALSPPSLLSLAWRGVQDVRGGRRSRPGVCPAHTQSDRTVNIRRWRRPGPPPRSPVRERCNALRVGALGNVLRVGVCEAMCEYLKQSSLSPTSILIYIHIYIFHIYIYIYIYEIYIYVYI